MRKQYRNYWITKCIMKYIIINIIASGSALSNPVKFTLGHRPPLSINYDTTISEQDNEPKYKKSDTYNNKDNNDVHLNGYDVITNNLDVIDDDADRLVHFKTNILNNVESSEYDDSEAESYINKENGREERELSNINTNVTTIYLAGYDDEIFQIKQEIQNKGTGKEVLICFYLCNDLHYNDLGCLYTDIGVLQNVLWKYSHYFCIDNQSLKPTWSLDDIFATYNFPNRKETIDDNVQVNIEEGLSDIEEDKKVKDTKSKVSKPPEIRKYNPKIIHPNENDQNGIDINVLKQKLKGQNIAGGNDNMRYMNPKYYTKKEYLEPGIENAVNTLEKEHNQNYLPIFPGTIANTMIINDINDNIVDGNLTHINIDHSAEPSIIIEPIKNKELIPNTNKNENNDKPEILKSETLEVIEDSTQNLLDQINSTSTNAENIQQYGNNSISLRNIANNTKYTNNTDDKQNNETFNDSNKKLSDDSFMNSTSSETNKAEPPNVEIVIKDNPLYDKHTDIDKLDDATLTEIYNNDQIPPILYNNRQNIFIPLNLNEDKVIFKQRKNSVDAKKIPYKDQTVNLLENNAKNKQLNTLATNPPLMYNFIKRQSNIKPHIPPCHSNARVNENPVSGAKSNIALVGLPPTYFKLNPRADDALTSVGNEKYPPAFGFDNKHNSPQKLTPNLKISNKLKPPTKSSKSSNTCLFNQKANKPEKRVPNYQNLDTKNYPIRKSGRIPPQRCKKKLPKVLDLSLPIDYYPKTNEGSFAHSNNEIKPLNEHYKCPIPRYTLANLKNNHTQRTNVKDFIKGAYLKIPPNSNIIKKHPQTFSKKINRTENIDNPIYVNNNGKYHVAEPILSKMFESNNKPVSQIQRKVWPVELNLKKIKNHMTNPNSSASHNFYTKRPTLLYKPLVKSPYSIFKENSSGIPTILSWPSPCSINKELNSNSFDFAQVARHCLKTKPELQKLPKTSATTFIPAFNPTKRFPNSNLGIISIDPISRHLQSQQCLKNPQSQKNLPLKPTSYAYSKKVNLSSELFYRFPLASIYDTTNKKKLKFPNYITTVIASINFKSILKTYIILPNKNLRFPLNVLCPLGVPCSISPTKYVPIASLQIKSVFYYLEIYDLLSLYKFLYTNSLLLKSLDGKIYPYYYIKGFKASLKAPIINTRLVVPISSSLITVLNSKGIPDRISFLPTSPNKVLISKVFPFPIISSLPISSNKVPLTNSLPIPTSSTSDIWPSLWTLKRGPISFPAPVQSSPICPNIDRRLNDYSIPYSSLQPASNVSAKLFHSPVSFFISRVLRSKGSPLPLLRLPILTNKELNTDSVPKPISSLPTSSLPIFSTIPTTISKPKTTPVSMKFLPHSSKPDLSSKGLPLPKSSLPISSNKEPETTVCAVNISSLPVSSASQCRLKTFQVPIHFLPNSFKPNHRSKGFPASTSSLPITTNLNKNLKGLRHFSLPITSNEDFNLKRFPTCSFKPVSTNKDSSSNGFLFPMLSLPIRSNKKEGRKRLPLPYLPISSALDREPESFPMNFKSLPCSNLDQNIKGFPPISYSPILPLSCYKPKTIPAFIQPLPVSSNLHKCLKGFPAPISSSPLSSPLELVPKTITSPVSKSYQFPLSSLPILSNKEVCKKINSNPNSSLPVSCPCPMLSTLEIKPKTYRKPMQPLPISSNKYFDLKDFSIPVISLPISSPLKAVPKNITSPILSLPFSPSLEVIPKNILLPQSSLHIPSTLEIGSNSFLPSVHSIPLASDIGFQPRYITPSNFPLPVSPNLGIKPKKCTEPIQSLPCLPNSKTNINLNSKGKSPVSYLPFSLNKDISLKGFSPTSEIRSNIFSVPIQDFPVASNFLPSISSSSELKPKTLPKPYQTLPVSSTINPCLKDPSIPVISSPVSPTLEVMPKSKAFPFLPSTSMTTEFGPKNLLRNIMPLPDPSTNRIKSNKILPPVPSSPISSAIKLQPKSIPRHIQPLPISPTKDLSRKDLPPTKLCFLIPSTLNLKPKALPTPNQSMSILSNNISWKVFPSRISPLPTSSPLELKQKTFPAPIESIPSSSYKHPSLKGYPTPVSPLPDISNRNPYLKRYPKHITPYLTLPLLKRTEIGSISPLILSNASTVQEPCRTEKDRPILADNIGLHSPHNATSLPKVFYLKPNSILLKPHLNIHDKPKNISNYTNFRSVPSPKSQEASYPIISNNTLYQTFNPYPSSKVLNPSKAFIPQDQVLFNPVPYSLISNNPPSEIIPNSYSNPYEQKTVQYYPNLKPMPQSQSSVLNNELPKSFIKNIPSLPFKVKTKINFPINEPKDLNSYLYFPFKSNQKTETIPLKNNTVQYLNFHNPKSTLNDITINPQSGSVLQNSSSQSKLKSINLPTRTKLNKLYNKPFFKSTITKPTVPNHTDTEKDKTYTTCNVQNDESPTQQYLQPILDTKYPADTYTPTFATNFEPIDSKSKLTSTLQSLLSAPSHYKEKLLKLPPYNSKLPIQSSNEEFIPDYVPWRKTQTKFGKKYPTEIHNPIQRNLHRITTEEVPKSINKICIYPKIKPPSCVYEKLYNNSINQSNKGILIPVGIAKYKPYKLNIKTNDPNIELKAWLSKLTVLKPKIVLDEVEITTFNFVPVVKNIAYTSEVVQDTVKRYIEKYFGKPIILKGIYSFCQPYHLDDKTRAVYIIWPTIYKCSCKL